MAYGDKCQETVYWETVLLFIVSVACVVVVALNIFMDQKIIKMSYFCVTFLQWFFLILLGFRKAFQGSGFTGYRHGWWDKFRFINTVVPTAFHTFCVLGGYAFQLEVKY